MPQRCLPRERRVRGEEAVGLIDFDHAAPGRPTYDLAQLAKMCVPLDRPERIMRLGWTEPDQAARLRLVADAYGLDLAGRVEFLAAIGDAMVVGERFVERRFRAGEGGFVAMVDQQGGMARWKDQQRWWKSELPRFEEALDSTPTGT